MKEKRFDSISPLKLRNKIHNIENMDSLLLCTYYFEINISSACEIFYFLSFLLKLNRESISEEKFDISKQKIDEGIRDLKILTRRLDLIYNFIDDNESIHEYEEEDFYLSFSEDTKKKYIDDLTNLCESFSYYLMKWKKINKYCLQQL